MTAEEVGVELAELKKEIRDELRALKLDIREARLEAREQYNQMQAQFNRFRLLIWLPIVTGALQVLAVILHK